MSEIRLSAADAVTASAIQEAIDSLGSEGGRVVLPAIELTLDRGLELRSNVELSGQGEGTILRKARGRLYPLAGYHNYGMRDVPLQFTDGLELGMTVAVRDSLHGGFFETFGRITWVDGTWVGLDCGLHSDYHASEEPILVTAYPLIYGLGVENVVVRDLILDGNRKDQPTGIGACRGAGIYFLRSHNVEVSGVQEGGFVGEGLGFQMCSDVRILRCRVANNTGNGYHPGAGSTGVLFEQCTAEGNEQAGFYFCVRANHVTVRGCIFRGNVACGISVGTRDCYNRIENCDVVDNGGPGILFRRTPRPVEVHSCCVSGCRVIGNARESGYAQIDVLGDAHDLVFADNQVSGPPTVERAGIYLAPPTERIWLGGNQMNDCFPEVIGGPICLAKEEPAFTSGHEATQAIHYRHLGRGSPEA